MLAWAFLGALWVHAAAPPPGELLVLVLFDATRADHLSSYGYSRPTTPSIDALAAHGTRFTKAYSNAPWTRPSTASFLTGLNTSRHHTETDTTKLPLDIPTLAGRLSQAGWTTAGFVANGHAGSLAGLQRDFAEFGDPTHTYVRGKRGTPLLNGLPVGSFIVEHALQYVQASAAPKLFVLLFLIDAHDPYQAPPELEKAFLGDFHGTIRRRAEWEYNNNYPADERFSMMAVYDAGIRAADRALGIFIDGLKAQGRWQKTTLVLSADHGEGFGEHGFYLHAHQFWEEVIHIPLVIAGPLWRQAAGSQAVPVDDRLVQSLDVTQTLLHLAGASGDGLPGHLLVGPPSQAPIISEYNEYGIHRQAIIDAHYKVIWQRPADTAWFLRAAKDKKYFPSVVFDHETVQVYDRQRDPDERHDLAGTMPAAATTLLDTLRHFVERP